MTKYASIQGREGGKEVQTLGKGSYANDSECPNRDQSSSAKWGAYGESNKVNASTIDLGYLFHWNRKMIEDRKN